MGRTTDARAPIARKLRVTDEEAKVIIEDAMSNGMLLWIKTQAWGNRKKISKDILSNKFGEDDAKIVRAVQDIVSQKFVREVTIWQDRAKRFANDNSMTWFHRGSHYISTKPYKDCNTGRETTKVEQCEIYLNHCKKNLEAKAMILANRIAELRQKAREDHPELNRDTHVPTPAEILNKFGLEWGWQKIVKPVDGAVTAISKDMVDAQNKQWQENIKIAGEECIDLVRDNFRTMLINLTRALKDPTKTFRKSTIEKPKVFLQELAEISLPFTDQPLNGVAKNLENLLEGVYSEDVRDDAEYRLSLSRSVNEVVQVFEDLPIIEIERDVDF